MRLGVHIRIEKGLVRSLDYARKLECEAIQLFSGNPNSWARKPLDPEIAAQFARRTAELNIRPTILHTPYLVNLASPDANIWVRSRDALADAVKRAYLMNAELVVTHIGSHKGSGLEHGISRISEAVISSLGVASGPTIVLELGAGAGDSVGSRFEEAAKILSRLEVVSDRVGICVDTAHLWGAGYDISTADGVDATFDRFDRLIGLDRLKVVHLNDTQVELGSRRDKHYHIGKGRIGIEGFRAILSIPELRDLPGIIETPGHDIAHDAENLAVLRLLNTASF